MPEPCWRLLAGPSYRVTNTLENINGFMRWNYLKYQVGGRYYNIRMWGAWYLNIRMMIEEKPGFARSMTMAARAARRLSLRCSVAGGGCPLSRVLCLLPPDARLPRSCNHAPQCFLSFRPRQQALHLFHDSGFRFRRPRAELILYGQDARSSLGRNDVYTP